MVHHRHLAEGMTSQMFRLARLTLEHMHGHLVVLRALLGEQHTHGPHISAAIEAIERYSHFASPGRWWCIFKRDLRHRADLLSSCFLLCPQRASFVQIGLFICSLL